MKNKNIKILLVDDNEDILEIIGFNIESEGYKLFTAKNGKEAIEIAEKEVPHLIILDIMMPVMDGMETCKALRKKSKLKDTVITFMTAVNEDTSQISGFDIGADDYITKPIKPMVLMSKIKSLLRRFKDNKNTIPPIKFGNVVINREKYKVYIDNKELKLPKKEFELLYLLASEPGRVFSRNEIMNYIWGDEVIVGERTIDVHIRKLREKIDDSAFKTIKGVGYKMEI